MSAQQIFLPMKATLEIILALSIFGVVYSYVVYPVILVVLSAIFGKPIRRSLSELPSVGVVIPAYNEERVIRKKIENILALDYPLEKLSIYVGSDHSTDTTDEIVRSFNNPRVRLWVAQTRGGKTQVLNQIVPDIDAEIVFFTDANTMHRRDSLRLLVRSFGDRSVGGVAGRIEHLISNEDGFEETMYRSFEIWQKRMESRLHSTISAFGGFYAIRKELFRPIPYNAYSNDDVLIPMNVIRQGKRIVFDADAVSQEDMAENVKLEFRRRIRIGAGNFQAFFWLLDFISPLRGWPAFCFLSHKVSRWFSPLFIIAAFISAGLLGGMTTFVFYKVIFAFAILVFACGLLYKIIRLQVLHPLYYFIVMNMALLLGLFRYFGGIKSAAWSRTERA